MQSDEIKKNIPIILIIILTAIIGVRFIANHPVQKLNHDEVRQLQFAHEAESWDQKLVKLVPGFMGVSGPWPPFSSAFIGLFSTAELYERYQQDKVSPKINALNFDNPVTSDISRFFNRIAGINLLMLIVSGILIYQICLLLNVRPIFSALATSLVVFNPRVLTYVQSLWCELLHLVMVLGAFYLLLRFFEKKGLQNLLFASLLMGYAALTKGIADKFFWILICIFLVIWAVKIAKQERADSHFLVVLLALCLPFLVVTHAQKIGTYRLTGTYTIAANTWINIEVGLKSAQGASFLGIYRTNKKSGADHYERELASKRRVVEYIKAANPLKLARSLTVRFKQTQLDKSYFTSSVTNNRWINSSGLGGLTTLTTVLSYFLMLVGGVGLALYGLRSPRHILLSSYLAYYLIALFIVAHVARFFVQAIPFLAIFAAMLIQDVNDYLFARFDRNASNSAKPD